MLVIDVIKCQQGSILIDFNVVWSIVGSHLCACCSSGISAQIHVCLHPWLSVVYLFVWFLFMRTGCVPVCLSVSLFVCLFHIFS